MDELVDLVVCCFSKQKTAYEMLMSLVGSEMCIRDRCNTVAKIVRLPKNTEVSIMIVDNSYIQKLNFIYRQQNRPTDVLSFAMNELSDDEPDSVSYTHLTLPTSYSV